MRAALVRELREEFSVDVEEQDLTEFGTYYAAAAGNEDKWLRMDVYG